ncbi:MAG: hypothetical protein EZS28_052157 [Streblomastix strix]|uniref:Uncharacterized protein n=1 Tax=Streblomastix strix TaxID=222440 RepID=A0A5J4SH53_9EUKA|nr:MAG: hypothetical protein EZS28_052157 [Streblomastix strix]
MPPKKAEKKEVKKEAKKAYIKPPIIPLDEQQTSYLRNGKEIVAQTITKGRYKGKKELVAITTQTDKQMNPMAQMLLQQVLESNKVIQEGTHDNRVTYADNLNARINEPANNLATIRNFSIKLNAKRTRQITPRPNFKIGQCRRGDKLRISNRSN